MVLLHRCIDEDTSDTQPAARELVHVDEVNERAARRPLLLPTELRAADGRNADADLLHHVVVARKAMTTEPAIFMTGL